MLIESRASKQFVVQCCIAILKPLCSKLNKPSSKLQSRSFELGTSGSEVGTSSFNLEKSSSKLEISCFDPNKSSLEHGTPGLEVGVSSSEREVSSFELETSRSEVKYRSLVNSSSSARGKSSRFTFYCMGVSTFSSDISGSASGELASEGGTTCQKWSKDSDH